MPVTFFMNEGSTADSKAFAEICAFITGHGLEIEGVILDRGFLSHSVIKMITDAGYDYVVKLKSSTKALTEMLEEHRQLISWNPEYLVGKGARFGIATKERVRLFASGDDRAYVAMYFDGKNGSERQVALADKMFAAMEKARQQAEAGITPRIDNSMSAYLALEEITGSEESSQNNNKDQKHAVEGSSWIIDCGEKRYRIAARKASVEKALRQKGIDGLASSRKMTAREMDEIYNLRDISEKQYMISKSMLGNKVFRAHSTQAIEAREAVCFIAAVIRCAILNACRRNGANTGRMIESMDEKAYLLLMPGQKYTFINKLTDVMKKVFRSFGLMPSDFETIAGDINERIRAGGIGVSQYHEMPEDIRLRHKRKNARKEQPENEKTGNKKANKTVRASKRKSKPAEKRLPGRPKGSRNKKTLEREARLRAEGYVEAPRRPRGRPVGSKDSKPRRRRTKAQMAAESAAI